jgi:hypothetical protein
MTYEVDEPGAITGMITGTMNLNCFGDQNGSLTVQAGGGAPPFTFLWSNGSSNQTINNLAAGTYSVTITDDNACTAVRMATISQPAQLLPNATATGVTGPGEMDGTATSAPTGGVGTYTFLWSNGETTATITGLAVGTYTVTVTDANSCTATQTVAVTGVNCALTVQVITTDALCFGESSGTAQANISGAAGPVEILWSTGEMTQLIVGLVAGMYSVTVTDSAGCIVATEAIVGQPDALLSTCVATGETMEDGNDGTITCSVAGGTAPYSFLWSNGDTTGALTGLAHGTYFATITDANGCTLFDTASVSQFACLLQLNLTLQSPTCFGDADGSASISINGGTAPYAILWSNGETSPDIDSLVGGAYGITVTDADDCVTELPFTLSQPDQITVTVDTIVHAVQGENGAIQVTIHGGTPPYTTVWTKNGGLVSTDEDITGLTPGDYQLEVIDANECVLAAGTVNVTVATGTRNDLAAVRVILWPNPTDEHIFIEVAALNEVWKGTLYGADGKMITEFHSGQLDRNGSLFRLNTSQLKGGLYYLKVAGASGHKVLPFIKA